MTGDFMLFIGISLFIYVFFITLTQCLLIFHKIYNKITAKWDFKKQIIVSIIATALIIASRLY